MGRIWVPDRKVIPYGQKFNGSTSTIVLPSGGNQFRINQPVTVLAYAYQAGGGGGNFGALYVKRAFAGGVLDTLRLAVSASAGYYTFSATSTGTSGGPIVASSAGSAANGQYIHLAGSWTGASVTASGSMDMHLGINHRPMVRDVGTGFTNGSGSLVTETEQSQYIGNRHDGLRAWNGRIFYVARWNRVLSLAELNLAQERGPLAVPDGLVLLWSGGRDHGPLGLIPASTTAVEIAEVPPVSLLGGMRRRLLFDGVAGGGASVAVPAASLTLTGNAPTVPVSANQTVEVPAGSLSLASYAPTVAVSDHKTVAVPTAALSVIGHAPTVSIGDAKTVAVPAASLAVAAYAPTVTASDHKTVAVPSAALSLQAYAPIVVSDGSQVVQVPRAQLALQAYAPTVSAAAPVSVEVPAGTLTLTGYAPGVFTSRVVAVPRGSLLLTGFAPTVTAASSVSAVVPVAPLLLSASIPMVVVTVPRRRVIVTT